MGRTRSQEALRREYEQAARDYLASLPLEHFMESTSQATQRKISWDSLDLVHAQRPEVQVFNELLVQYPLGEDTARVVPDNMVVIHTEAIDAEGSFDAPFQPVGPFWVLEYVSQGNKRKDYDENFRKYESELKVPYYLIFYPDGQELTLYRRGRTRYASVRPNEHGRYAIPELEVEVALLDGWVRFWFRGKLLPLPADMQRELNRSREENTTLTHERDQAREEAEAARRLAAELGQELERLRAKAKRKKSS